MTVLVYDEAALHSRLVRMSRPAMAAIALSTAERLYPLFRLGASDSDQATSAVTLRAALDDLWQALETGHLRTDEDPATVAISLVPADTDPGWTAESAFMQNSAAATAYAARAWASGDPQEAVWALRQAVEAADYAVQSRSTGHVESWKDPLVQSALAAIENDFDDVEAQRQLDTVRARASSTQSWTWKLASDWIMER